MTVAWKKLKLKESLCFSLSLSLFKLVCLTIQVFLIPLIILPLKSHWFGVIVIKQLLNHCSVWQSKVSAQNVVKYYNIMNCENWRRRTCVLRGVYSKNKSIKLQKKLTLPDKFSFLSVENFSLFSKSPLRSWFTS